MMAARMKGSSTARATSATHGIGVCRQLFHALAQDADETRLDAAAPRIL